MKKKAFIIEYHGGSDKGFDGFRPDTKPILDAIEEVLNIKTEVVFYVPSKKEELKKYLQNSASYVISRINPGNLKEVDGYFCFLKELGDFGIEVFTHPDVMINLDFKDILAKLKDTPLGEQSTHFYHTFEDFTQDFPPVLREETVRVLKTNYGSTGEGVYLVHFNEDQTVDCIEAVNNKKIAFSSIYDFLKFFEDKFEDNDKNLVYFKGKTGFVSCKYLSRINEGEIRILLVKDRVVAVVNKVPKEGEFSATLFSGAKYEYEKPTLEKWRKIVEFTLDGLDFIEPYCKGKSFPLLWTMDYILDYDDKMKDIYVLSEINCSCVGITTDLAYAKDVAKALK